MTSPFRFAAAVVVAASLTACKAELFAPDKGDLIDVDNITATVESESAVAGAIVDVRFVSRSDEDYYLSACAREVERLVDGSWRRLPAELRFCVAQIDGLVAHGSATLATDVPVDVLPGTHRFVFSLIRDEAEFDEPQRIVYSTPFTVR